MRAALPQCKPASPAVIAVLSAALLAGCVSSAAAPDGGTLGGAASGGTLAMGPHSVTLDGVSLRGELRPGPAGVQLSGAGARPVLGQEIRISAVPGLTGTSGALAKKAARQTCAAAGGRFNEQAIGGYDRAGAWLFAGACA